MKKLIKLYCTLSLLVLFGCNNDSENNSEVVSQVGNTISATTEVVDDKKEKKKTILFFGDSLSAGYGVNEDECFPGLIGQRIDSLGLAYKVVNAGLSGETTAGGAARIDWILKQPIDIFILELGGNDGLRGIKPESSYENLQAIIKKTKTKYPEVEIIIAGMMAPPNMGEDFTTKFRNIFPKIAEENGAELIPFLLENVGGIPSLNQPDGIHPTPEGHKIVTENVWNILKNLVL